MPHLKPSQLVGGKNAIAMILAAGFTGPGKMTKNYPCRYGYYEALESYRSGGYKPLGCITATDAAFRYFCNSYLYSNGNASNWVAPHQDKRKSATRYIHTICPNLGLFGDEVQAINHLAPDDNNWADRSWRTTPPTTWAMIRDRLQGLDNLSHLWALFYGPRPMFWAGLRSNFPMSSESKKLFIDGFRINDITNNKFLRVIDEIDDLVYDSVIRENADVKRTERAWLMALSSGHGMSLSDTVFTKQLMLSSQGEKPDLGEAALMSAVSGNGVPAELLAILVAQSLSKDEDRNNEDDRVNKQRAGLLVIQAMMSNDRELNAKLVAIAMKFGFFDHLKAADIQQFFHPLITAYAVGKVNSRDPALAYVLLAMAVSEGANTDILLPQIISSVFNPTPATKAKVDRLSLELMVVYNNGFKKVFKMVKTLGNFNDEEERWFKRILAPDTDLSKGWLRTIIQIEFRRQKTGTAQPFTLDQDTAEKNHKVAEAVRDNATLYDEYKARIDAITVGAKRPAPKHDSMEHVSWEALKGLGIGVGTAASVAEQIKISIAPLGGSQIRAEGGEDFDINVTALNRKQAHDNMRTRVTWETGPGVYVPTANLLN